MKNIFIIGGTGQLGIILSKYLLKKNKKVIITSRYKKNVIKKKNFEIIKLNIFNKKKIKDLIIKHQPEAIFYFAGQSSPIISFKKKDTTLKSNFNGCKNFLESIYKLNKNIKFFNASSSEIFSDSKNKLKVTSKKKPTSPYGQAKLKSYNLTKYYREKKELKSYNIILFNSESILRKNFFLFPKICKAAIAASRYNKKTSFGNIDIVREWNWADDQCELMAKFLEKKPQDFILSNGKTYSVKEMISYAFEYFKLDYRKYIKINKIFWRKNEVKIKQSDYLYYLKKNNINKKSFIHGKKLVHLMIKFYLNR